MFWGFLVGSVLPSAVAGEAEVEATLDHLAAVASFEDGVATAGEVGMRFRGTVVPTSRITVAWDYRGREPVYGTFPNRPLRLLYGLVVQGTPVDGGPTVTLGRFLAPSVVLLPVDGIKVDSRFSGGRASIYAGRRGILTSRRNVPLRTLLPAVGGDATWMRPRLRFDLAGALYQDQLVLGTPGAELVEAYTTGNAKVAATWWPREGVRLGGRLVTSPRVRYDVVRSDRIDWTVEATGLYAAGAWADWRLGERWRVGADALRQRALVESVDVPVLAPTFTDLRLRAAWRPEGIGWLRMEVVRRLRGFRGETRVRGTAEVTEPGPVYLRGHLEVVGVDGFDQPDDLALVDRLFWRVGGGMRREVVSWEAGVSLHERAIVPVSGSSGDLLATTPKEEVDLQLTVLESQSVAYARAFAAFERWFLGADVEANVFDREVRVLVQVGTLQEVRW